MYDGKNVSTNWLDNSKYERCVGNFRLSEMSENDREMVGKVETPVPILLLAAGDRRVLN